MELRDHASIITLSLIVEEGAVVRHNEAQTERRSAEEAEGLSKAVSSRGPCSCMRTRDCDSTPYRVRCGELTSFSTGRVLSIAMSTSGIYGIDLQLDR